MTLDYQILLDHPRSNGIDPIIIDPLGNVSPAESLWPLTRIDHTKDEPLPKPRDGEWISGTTVIHTYYPKSPAEMLVALRALCQRGVKILKVHDSNRADAFASIERPRPAPVRLSFPTTSALPSAAKNDTLNGHEASHQPIRRNPDAAP